MEGSSKAALNSLEDIVWVLLLHPATNEPESRVVRTQDARLLVSALRASPVHRPGAVARVMYVLGAQDDYRKWCTPTSKKIIETKLAAFIVPCSTFDMLFDITKHALCPASKRVSGAEVIELCKRLRCPDTHKDRVRIFPHLKRDDPVCKMCGYLEGDVVAFDRGTHVYWRIVVR